MAVAENVITHSSTFAIDVPHVVFLCDQVFGGLMALTILFLVEALLDII